jgi:(5-formylfuran-3-yl)methyl phosphate synthase
MTGMLASVGMLEEAEQVLWAGADIIDIKAPAAGALGALPTQDVKAIVRRIGSQRPVSATIGDLPLIPETIADAVEAMAATGVDFIKIGFFPGGDPRGTIAALKNAIADGARLVAVLFADQNPDLELVADLAAAGFSGVMLDTVDKKKGSLRQVYPPNALQSFVGLAKTHGLLCGLAGSLREEDIAPLLELAPDYLGFRGALCQQRKRTNGLDQEAIEQILGTIHNLFAGAEIGRCTERQNKRGHSP